MKEATKDQTADRIILMCPLEDKDQDINRLSQGLKDGCLEINREEVSNTWE